MVSATRWAIAKAAKWTPAEHVSAANCPVGWLMFSSGVDLMSLGQADTMGFALWVQYCAATQTNLRGPVDSLAYW